MQQADRYVYPGTDVLINKFGCRDAQRLKEIEILSTGGNLAWLQLHPIDGKFDFKHLRDIHYAIFQDLYDWAGQIREVDIGKNNLFCRAQYINEYAKTVFKDFFLLYYPELLESPKRMSRTSASGIRLATSCLKCGYVFDLTRTTHQEMLSASILSFNQGDNSGLIAIFSKCIIPIDEYHDYQSRLTSALLILSSDDI